MSAPPIKEEVMATEHAAGGEPGSFDAPMSHEAALPPGQPLLFAVSRPYANVREDRSAMVSDGPGRLRFMINSRTWRNSWMLQVILTDHGWARVPVEQRDWDLWWCAGQANTRAIRELQPWQRLNKFPKSSTLTLKAHLYFTIKSAAARCGEEHFTFMPETYVLPSELDEFEERRSRPANAEAIWIVKPYAAYCGRGIFLMPNAAEVPAHVLDDRAVVSRYIDRPYLINGLKSDIRLYVLVTCWHPLIVYVFHNGLVRFATEAYTLDPDNLDKRTAHITNYTLNKRSTNFKATAAVDDDGTGSKWTLDALRAHMVADAGQEAADAAWRAVDDLLAKTCIAAEPDMLESYDKYVPEQSKAQPHASVFQLFGFDVMLDAALKPWLLEVNLDPALGTDSPLDFKVRPRARALPRFALVPCVASVLGSPQLLPPFRVRPCCRSVANSVAARAARAAQVKSAMLADTLNILGLSGHQAAQGHGKAAAPAAAEEARSRLAPEQLREWRALAQANGELERSRTGGFRRLLPAADPRTYAHLFPPGRDLNALPFAR